MNRLHHLQETLPMNLADCETNNNVEFVILDYNSSDGLEHWMKNNFHHFSSKVAYYKTTEPSYYNRSHSRNMAFRLASGDIVCNLDADNFAGKGFAEYIESIFRQNQSVFVTPKDESLSDTFGKVCMTKNDFMQIRGYDEAIKGYGFEDYDIKNRLLNLGRTQIDFEQIQFLKAIGHSEEERIKNEFTYNHLESLFVEKINLQQTKLFFIYKDSTYESAIIADSIYTKLENQDYFIKPLKVLNRYYIVKKTIKKGNFYANLTSNATIIEKQETIVAVINFYSQLTNKLRFMDNFHNKRIVVNTESFGHGTVIKNFANSNPITLA